MLRPREAGEKAGRAIARRSPRLAGTFGILFAAALCGLSFYLRKGTLLIIAGLMFGGCVWVGITGRNWEVPDDKPPTWWKAGLFVFGGAGVAAAYAYIFSTGLFGL